MNETYSFANNLAGRTQRSQLRLNLEAEGRVCEEFEDIICDVLILRLRVLGKRKGEGLIAADMKARKGK
jgi:hypothetical protein